MTAAILAILLAAAADVPVPADIGDEPAMEAFIALAEPALLSKAPRAKEVTFIWPYRLTKSPFSYYTCGKVATNRGRAVQEEVWVSAAVANGNIVSAQWSTSNGILAWDCKRKVRSGNLVAR